MLTTEQLGLRVGQGILPPTSTGLSLHPIADVKVESTAPAIGDEPQPIAGFLCVIEYSGEHRLITCRRYDVKGDMHYVGAICHSAGGYRQFRGDRIASVCDAQTGEVIGDGSYFSKFAPATQGEAKPQWGLTRGQQRTLTSGLNILAFMARCDGQWHPLEDDPIEQFTTSLWLQREWPGEPPMEDIIFFARRLAPDAGVFFSSLKPFVRGEAAGRLIRRAVNAMISADGIITAEEHRWVVEFTDHLEDLEAAEFSQYLGGAATFVIDVRV